MHLLNMFDKNTSTQQQHISVANKDNNKLIEDSSTELDHNPI